jgi:predicted transglutaminase-like cysteine proteinase
MKISIKKILFLVVFFLILIIFSGVQTFAEESTGSPLQSFSDIPSGYWAEEAIIAMAHEGIINGVDSSVNDSMGKFDPNGILTMEQFIAIIVRATVSKDQWEGDLYGPAWAYLSRTTAEKTGFYSTLEEEFFDFVIINHKAEITREQMALLIVRAARYSGRSLEILPTIDQYIADFSLIDNKYQESVGICYSKGILGGVDDIGTFLPNKTLTRAEGASVVYRLLQINGSETVLTPSIIVHGLVMPTEEQYVQGEYDTPSISMKALNLRVGDVTAVKFQNISDDVVQIAISGALKDPLRPDEYSALVRGDVATIDEAGVIKAVAPGKLIVSLFVNTSLRVDFILTVQDELIQSEQQTQSALQIPVQEEIPSDSKKVEFTWIYPEYLKKEWDVVGYLSNEIYSSLKNIDHEQVTYNFGYGAYVALSESDTTISKLVEYISNTAKNENYNEVDLANMVINFTQSLEYISDKISTGYDEYPKFPFETLYDQGGDCEDIAILMATMLRKLGYRVVLVAWPDTGNGNDGHMAIGIKGSHDLQGAYFIGNNGARYYYIETTGGTSYNVGDIPEELKTRKAFLIYL